LLADLWGSRVRVDAGGVQQPYPAAYSFD
jgi:hypothetical protein